MGQHKKQKFREERDFDGRLQSDATAVVKAAQYLVDNKVAKWQIVAMPDGEEWVALLFTPSMWEIKDNRLTLKPKKSSGA